MAKGGRETKKPKKEKPKKEKPKTIAAAASQKGVISPGTGSKK